jgi:hypothetical protein
VKQRRLRLMTAQPLLNNINKMIDITKMQAFLGGEFQLPADALFGKERGPATLPGVRLGWWKGRCQNPDQTAADRSTDVNGRFAGLTGKRCAHPAGEEGGIPSPESCLDRCRRQTCGTFTVLLRDSSSSWSASAVKMGKSSRSSHFTK